MTTILIALGALFVAGELALAWLYLTAPYGYEDADGFHLGHEPFADPGHRQHHAGGSARASFHGADYA